MANESRQTTEEMINRMADEGGGAERNAKPMRPLVKKAGKDSTVTQDPHKKHITVPTTISNISDNPSAWEADPENLRSPVG